MFDEGVPGICLFQMDGINTFVQMQNELWFHYQYKIQNHEIHSAFGQKCFYAIRSSDWNKHISGTSLSIITILSLSPLWRKIHDLYLEMDIIFSRFILFLKYSPPSNDCIFFFFDTPGIGVCMHEKLYEKESFFAAEQVTHILNLRTSKLSTLFLKNIVIILKQIVWENVKILAGQAILWVIDPNMQNIVLMSFLSFSIYFRMFVLFFKINKYINCG